MIYWHILPFLELQSEQKEGKGKINKTKYFQGPTLWLISLIDLIAHSVLSLFWLKKWTSTAKFLWAAQKGKINKTKYF